MKFKLNFLGITVEDFKSSFHFYNEVLGIKAKYSKSNWAAFDTTGMKFELFSGGESPLTDQSWGHGQAVRPSFQVSNLKTTLDDLGRKGVRFEEDIKKASWGDYIEFIAPEGIHWILAYASTAQGDTSLRRPHIGSLEMKTLNIKNQVEFYTNLLGSPIALPGSDDVVFRQHTDESVLVLEQGGNATYGMKSYYDAPLFIGFETSDIEEAEKWLESKNIQILTGMSKHSWGIDLVIADADGNPVQIAQYT